MKKWIVGSLILIALMVVAAGVYAQTTEKEKKQAKKECTFVDKNKDGKCDTCGSTEDKCQKESKTTTTQEGHDCSKCPSAAKCEKSTEGVVPATEGSAPSTDTAPCCSKK